MASASSTNTSSNLSIPGIVMKSALVNGKLSACCMNGQSMCARKMTKLNELRNIAMVSRVDVMCVCESWLNESVPNDVISIENYIILRNDRVGRLGGGVLVYLKKDLKFKIIEMSASVCDRPQTEYILLEIKLGEERILLGFFYNPPQVDSCTVLNEKLSCISNQYDNILLMGDFNTNMMEIDADRCKRFKRALNSLSLECIGSEPTHFHRTGASQIDLMITNCRSKILKFNQVSVPFLSNHDLIFASYDMDYSFSPKSVSYRDYNQMDPGSVIALYNTIGWNNFYEMDNPDSLVEFLAMHVQNLHDSCVPLKTFHKRSRFNAWFDSNISKEIINRDLAFRKWKSSQDEGDHECYRRLRNKVTNIITKAKETHECTFVAYSQTTCLRGNSGKNLIRLD